MTTIITTGRLYRHTHVESQDGNVVTLDVKDFFKVSI